MQPATPNCQLLIVKCQPAPLAGDGCGILIYADTDTGCRLGGWTGGKGGRGGTKPMGMDTTGHQSEPTPISSCSVFKPTSKAEHV